MKGRLYLLATLCAILSGCNQNTPDDPTTKNQPANPSTWSPAGKMYICDRSNDNPYKYSYFMEVIYFRNSDSAFYYGTTNKDLSPIDKHFNHASYKIAYPNITITFGKDRSYLSFQDTLTIIWESSKLSYTLH